MRHMRAASASLGIPYCQSTWMSVAM